MAGSGELVELSRNKQFRLLWTGQILSLTGTGVAVLAYPLLVLSLTHSAVIAGAVGTARAATSIALQLPGGALADRWDRRRTLIVCDCARCLVLTGLAIIILAGAGSWPIVAAVAVIDAAGGAIFTPAATAALPVIVPEEQLKRAWALTEARVYASGLAGPSLGGALYAIGKAVPFVADAVSYAVSALTASKLTGDFRPDPAATTDGLLDRIRDGMRYAWHSPLLRPIIIVTPLTNFAFTGAEYSITLALRRSGVSSGEIGVLQGLVAGGGLAGAILATTQISHGLTLRQQLILNSSVGAALLTTAAWLAPSVRFALPVALVLLPAPALNASLLASVMTTVPKQLHGRIISTITLTAMGPSALAPLAAGVLLTHTTPHATLAVFALSMALTIPLGLRLPHESVLKQVPTLHKIVWSMSPVRGRCHPCGNERPYRQALPVLEPKFLRDKLSIHDCTRFAALIENRQESADSSPCSCRSSSGGIV